MKTDTLEDRLLKVANSTDALSQLESLTQELRESGADVTAVQPILMFMEAHADIDMGGPGPLVHFVEQFFGAGYEAELLASITRRPTAHAVWMLNRVINGTKTSADRQKLIIELQAAEHHPAADSETRQRVASFMKRLSE
jgi:hypothetical protein